MSLSVVDSSKSVSKITGEPLKKRGRKSKKDLLQNELMNQSNNLNQSTNPTDNIVISIEENNVIKNAGNNEENIDNTILIDDINNEDEENINNEKEQKPAIKKRGRKPKGGKIIQQVISFNNNKDVKPNIILHLKCSLKDLYKGNSLEQSIENPNFMSYNEYSYDSICKINNTNNVNVTDNQSNNFTIQNILYQNNISEETDKSYENNDYNDDNYNNFKSNSVDSKDIFKKLKNLEHNLHINNINDKKSACFWCTCDFDNPPIYIPKHFIKDTYEVYGCFCSPECATAHLMEEHIDSSDKFERYHLINHIYTKIYDYKKNIKPAPNPYYMLDKYYGNLTIQEYRSLLRSERLFLVVDKPLTRILPELHEDNDDFIINNKIIPSNSFQVKKKLQKKTTKNNIVSEKFGLTSQ
jgi:hypothetical protein